MRLSDVKGDRTLDVVAEIIEPIINIASDKAAGLFAREKVPEGETRRSFLLSRVKKTVPALLKGHKQDVIHILATIEGKTAEEYAGALNLPKLLRDCTELLTDESFEALFISAQSGENSSSGSAPENTEG